MAVIKRQDIIKYAVISLMFVLTSLAKIDNRMLPLSLSVYAALTYCGLNIAIISPLYIFSCLFNGLTLTSLIYAITPVVICVLSKLIHKRIKKDFYILEILIYVFLSLLPIFFITKTIDERIFLTISIVLLLIFTYTSMSIFFALFIRKNITNLSIDEKVALFILIMCLSLGLTKIRILSFEICLVVFGFIIEYCIFKNSVAISLCLLLSISLGYGMHFYNVSSVAGILTTYLVAYSFKKLNKYISVVAILLIDFIMGSFFKCYINYSYLHIIAIGVGALLFVVLPNKLTQKWPSLNVEREKSCINEIIRRDKKEIIKKLNIAESVIYQLAGNYTSMGNQNLPREELIKRMANEVSLEVCQTCRNRDYCFKTLNMSPEIALRNAIDVALISSKVTVNELPLSMSSKCVCLGKMLDKITNITSVYLKSKKQGEQHLIENQFLAMQMAGVGSVLGSISEEMKVYPKASKDLEEKLIATLGYSNIICKEAVFFSSQNKASAMLIVREKDKDNKIIEEVLSKVLNIAMIKIDEEIKKEEALAYLYFESKPIYELVYNNIVSAKNGSLYCGDSQTVIKIKENKVLIVLCDGMGTGKNAQQTSTKTLELVQDFYRAGIDSSKALILINRALACLNRENFTAVDMCVVDLNFGSVDFIKLGAVPSFIKKEEGIKIVESGALPLGIIDNAKPNVTREVISTSDILVMVSDGILDTLKVEGIKEILHRIDSKNPKTISEEIFGQAKIRGLQDDASIIVFRIYKKV